MQLFIFIPGRIFNQFIEICNFLRVMLDTWVGGRVGTVAYQADFLWVVPRQNFAFHYHLEIQSGFNGLLPNPLTALSTIC